MARQKNNDILARTAFLGSANAAYIETLYQKFQNKPQSVTDQWRMFFRDIAEQDMPGQHKHHSKDTPLIQPPISLSPAEAIEPQKIAQQLKKQAQKQQICLSEEEIFVRRRETVHALWLIHAYRLRGHLVADLDPLDLRERRVHPELLPEAYGFTHDDLDRPIFLDGVLGLEVATLRDIIAILHRTYCQHVGIEYMHISVPKQRAWLQQRIEGLKQEISFTQKGKKAILNKIYEAEIFEQYLDVKYRGTKRFGLDGGESIIPAMEQIIKRGGTLGVKQIILGMPHRGRLNVLANVMGKPHRAIFHEFLGGSSIRDDIASGDVKYHLGASSDREFDANQVHLSLSPNPSHLEAVDPIVLGRARAKQTRIHSNKYDSVLPVLLHGDAAFAGQGIVSECFALSDLPGHRVGGSLHLIINNQIGFTTSPQFARSSPYPSASAKMVEAPIFHVNGDDPEAVVHVAKIATEYRQLFNKPVVIDMFCYRRHGHNEADNPSITQPLMYERIKDHPIVSEIYSQRLIDEKVITEEDATKMQQSFKAHLDVEFRSAPTFTPGKPDWLRGLWAGLSRAKDGPRKGYTGISEKCFDQIGHRVATIPTPVNAHKTVRRIYNKRFEMIETGEKIDWATAEALAFGSLIREGFSVRLSGQDVERGTFAHRHCVIVDQKTEKKYIPLQHITSELPRFEVVNSMLSEFAVLGFEYGYSLSTPDCLVLWEGQFGDFANGAQVIIDQFISSAEAKWLRMSSLVMLLPHGYEGQGPEHSSARLERYLQLSAEDNWQVANCTTPANYFHILRRQLQRNFRKPLILMAPKSLLRHPLCVSQKRDFSQNSSFHRILEDGAEVLPNQPLTLATDEKIKRVILCSGKVYFDLYEQRNQQKNDDIYLLRVEQLYPFPKLALRAFLARFNQAHFVWCQEEPENMGAWFFVRHRIEHILEEISTNFPQLTYIGRPASASTAAGLMKNHNLQREKFLNQALSLQI